MSDVTVPVYMTNQYYPLYMNEDYQPIYTNKPEYIAVNMDEEIQSVKPIQSNSHGFIIFITIMGFFILFLGIGYFLVKKH